MDATADDLPLGALGPLVDELRHEVLHGGGLALLRGFPVDRRTVDELGQMFWGIGLRLRTRAVGRAFVLELSVVTVLRLDPCGCEV